MFIVYLCEVGENFRGGVVRHLTDNKCVESICRIGSRVPALHSIAVALYMKCGELNITLLVEWRSRDDPLIAFADVGSRLFDESSYSLDFNSFMRLVEAFPHVSLVWR